MNVDGGSHGRELLVMVGSLINPICYQYYDFLALNQKQYNKCPFASGQPQDAGSFMFWRAVHVFSVYD